MVRGGWRQRAVEAPRARMCEDETGGWMYLVGHRVPDALVGDDDGLGDGGGRHLGALQVCKCASVDSVA